MTLLPFCQWLAATRGSIALHESLFMYPLVESTHVLMLCLFLGMAVMLDLRLLGLALGRVPMSEITRRLGPWMVAGFVMMVTTGVLLFYAIPVRSTRTPTPSGRHPARSSPRQASSSGGPGIRRNGTPCATARSC